MHPSISDANIIVDIFTPPLGVDQAVQVFRCTSNVGFCREDIGDIERSLPDREHSIEGCQRRAHNPGMIRSVVRCIPRRFDLQGKWCSSANDRLSRVSRLLLRPLP